MAACLDPEVVDTRFVSLSPTSRTSVDSCNSARRAMGTCHARKADVTTCAIGLGYCCCGSVCRCASSVRERVLLETSLNQAYGARFPAVERSVEHCRHTTRDSGLIYLYLQRTSGAIDRTISEVGTDKQSRARKGLAERFPWGINIDAPCSKICDPPLPDAGREAKHCAAPSSRRTSQPRRPSEPTRTQPTQRDITWDGGSGEGQRRVARRRISLVGGDSVSIDGEVNHHSFDLPVFPRCCLWYVPSKCISFPESFQSLSCVSWKVLWASIKLSKQHSPAFLVSFREQLQVESSI